MIHLLDVHRLCVRDFQLVRKGNIIHIAAPGALLITSSKNMEKDVLLGFC